MSLDAWITAGVLVAMVVMLVTELVPPTYGVLAANVVLLTVGITDLKGAFGGLASSAPLAVAGFYMVASGVEKTGGLLPVVNRVLPVSDRVRPALIRLAVPAAVMSAFLNNTPIVAMLIDPVRSWSRRTRVPVSKVLIPLSYATILGGSLTLIGTSTTLVVSDLLQSSGQRGLGFFEPAEIALPVAVLGLLTIVLLGPKVLPDRTGDTLGADADARMYFVYLKVQAEGPVAGRTLKEADIADVTVAGIRRDDVALGEVGSDFRLVAGDELTVVASAADVVELLDRRGLTSATTDDLASIDGSRARFYEAVVGSDSPLVGQRIGELAMADQYGAAVLAVHRAGRHMPAASLDQLRVREGDTLLLLGRHGFRQRWGDRADFLLVNRLGGRPPASTAKAPLALGTLVGVVGLAAFGVLNVATAALAGGLLMVPLGVLTPKEVFGAVNWAVVLMIASAFGIGTAVQNTGLADKLASGVIDGFGAMGQAFMILGLLFATAVLTELISNAAAAVLAFPIALDVAHQLGRNPRPLAIAVGVVASCSFITPVGYQTNTMVFGPGGYRFTDYMRLGAILEVVALTVVTFMVLLVS